MPELPKKTHVRKKAEPTQGPPQLGDAESVVRYDPKSKRFYLIGTAARANMIDVGAKAPALTDRERWNNLCAAAAEDVLHDERPPDVSAGEVARIRERIFDLMASHRRKP